LAEIERSTGLSREELGRAMAKLEVADPPFFDGTRIGELSYPVTVTGITERALVKAGQWPIPESLVEGLIAALNRAAEDEPDPEKKTKLKQAAGLPGGAAVQVVIGWITGALPHP
jgi:hypothetical protein